MVRRRLRSLASQVSSSPPLPPPPLPPVHHWQAKAATTAVGPAAAAVAAAYYTGAALRRQFAEHGFLVIEGALSAEELLLYRSMSDVLVRRAQGLSEDAQHTELGHSFSLEQDPINGGRKAGVLHKVQGVITAEPRFMNIARHPSILPIVQGLLCEQELDIFGTKFFPKLPGGTSVNWHQDNFAFGHDVQADRDMQEQIVSLAIYLDDADAENGCLRVIPSSHKHGYLPPPPHISQNSIALDPHAHLSMPRGAPPLPPARSLPCKAGTCVVFSANMLHSAGPNRSASRSRYSLFWHYLPGCLLPQRFGLDYKDRHQV